MTPTHDPIVEAYAGTHWQPGEITVTCTCGGWEFFSQESAGGGLEAWGDDWQDHLDDIENGDPES